MGVGKRPAPSRRVRHAGILAIRRMMNKKQHPEARQAALPVGQALLESHQSAAFQAMLKAQSNPPTSVRAATPRPKMAPAPALQPLAGRANPEAARPLARLFPTEHLQAPATLQSQLIFSLEIETPVHDTRQDVSLDVSKDVALISKACQPDERQRQVIQHVQALKPLCMTANGAVDLWQLGVLLRSKYGYLVRQRTANIRQGNAYLRKLRHSYLICKPPEDGTGGGDILVDLNFKDHFALPHGCTWYNQLLSAVPQDWVGSAEGAAAVARVLAAGMRLVFLQLGTPLPPWRERRALLSKWLPEVFNDELIPLQPHADQNAGIAAMLAPYEPLSTGLKVDADLTRSDSGTSATSTSSTAMQGITYGTSATGSSTDAMPSAAALHRLNWIPNRAGAAAGATTGGSQSTHSRHTAFQPRRVVVGFAEHAVRPAAADAVQHAPPPQQSVQQAEEAQVQSRDTDVHQGGGQDASKPLQPKEQVTCRQLHGAHKPAHQRQRVLVQPVDRPPVPAQQEVDAVATLHVIAATTCKAHSGAPAAVSEGSHRGGKCPVVSVAAPTVVLCRAAAVAGPRSDQLPPSSLPAAVVAAGAAGGGRVGPSALARPYQALEHLLPRIHTVKLVGVR